MQRVAERVAGVAERAFVSGADESMLVARPPLQRVQCLARAGRSPRGRGRGRRTAPNPHPRPPTHPPAPLPPLNPSVSRSLLYRRAFRLPFGRGSTTFCFPTFRRPAGKKINASVFVLPPWNNSTLECSIRRGLGNFWLGVLARREVGLEGLAIAIDEDVCPRSKPSTGLFFSSFEPRPGLRDTFFSVSP